MQEWEKWDLYSSQDTLLFASIILLGIGFLWKRNEAHLSRAFGWVLFGIFWWIQIPPYLRIQDYFNAIASGLALPVFLFFTYHELLSFRWKEDYPPLKFLVGATFIASLLYFAVDRVPILAGSLIKAVAENTVGVLNALGHSYSTGPTIFPNSSLWYRTTSEEIYVDILPQSSGIKIVLACTALQAIAVDLSFILGTQAAGKRKGIALLATLPPIYVVNILRNALIIYLFDVRSVSFEMAHGFIGKLVSAFTLVVLVIVVFEILPELYDNISGVIDLAWRKEPGHKQRPLYERLGGGKT